MSGASTLPIPEEHAILDRMADIPIFATLAFDQVKLIAGGFESVVPHREQYDGIFKCFHGGMLMTIADSAAAMAALTVCGASSTIATTDMNIRFLRAVHGSVRVNARVLKPGRTLIPVAAELFDKNGTLAAVAQVTYIVITPAPARTGRE